MPEPLYSLGDVALVPVKSFRDAIVLHCDRCGKVADTLPLGPWGLDTSAGLHKSNGRCDPRGVRYYGLPRAEGE